MNRTEVATLGGGCFWCIEAVLEQLQGVHKVVSGYAGGDADDPTYEEVCAGHSGHAEVVQVAFDPATITYREILQVFWSVHDPTTPDRQGADVGTQYRSVVFTHSPEQRRVAEEVLAELTKDEVYDAPIVTQIAPLTKFYAGEEYHQQYFRNNPRQPYCSAVISPKVAKFRKNWAGKLKQGP